MGLDGSLDGASEPKLVVKHTFLDWSYDEEADEEGGYPLPGRGRGRSMSDFDVSYGSNASDDADASPYGATLARVANRNAVVANFVRCKDSYPLTAAGSGDDGEASDGRDAQSAGEGEGRLTVSTATPEEDQEDEEDEGVSWADPLHHAYGGIASAEEVYYAISAPHGCWGAPGWDPYWSLQTQQSWQQPQPQSLQQQPHQQPRPLSQEAVAEEPQPPWQLLEVAQAPQTGVREEHPSPSRRRRARRKSSDFPPAPEAQAASPVALALPSNCDVGTTQAARTTLMLRNVPNSYSRDMLLELLDSEGLAGRYDFVYAPVDFTRQAGLGFAFVNMVTDEDAEHARSRLQGFSYWSCPSAKVLDVSWSDPFQGLAAHIERYRNSPVMHEDVPDEYKPVLFVDGVRVSFPASVRKIRPPRVKRSGRANGHARGPL